MIEAFDLNKPLSLYIHVPFCTSKCKYCAFYSLANCSDVTKSYYMNRIVNEIDSVVAAMDGKPFYTAFIGGGNPGCLSVEELETIAKAVCRNGRPSEFSVEMNPESLTEEHFPLFGQWFTRLSMGIQSLDERALRFLGRNATLEQTLKGLEMSQKLRDKTGCKVSYDLITCLGPWHDALSDVKTIVNKYPADHLSVYALTLEEGTALYRENPVLPDNDQQYEILKEIWNYLSEAGYEHYEVSNFAKGSENRCVHNCVYWGYRQYLGLGPGAASTAFNENGSVRRFLHPYDVRAFNERPCFEGYEVEDLSDIEALEELVLMGLRYRGGLDLGRLKRDFGVRLEDGELSSIEHFHVEGESLVPDEDGLMVADAVAEKVVQMCLASLTAK